MDPTGEVAWFIPWLLKASAEAAVDALLQATISYFFDPSVTSVEQAINSIDLRRVGIAFLVGLLPGGRLAKAGLAAAGDVIINYLDALARCEEYTAGQAITDFARSVATQLLFEKGLELVGRFGKWAVQRGFERLGLGEKASEFLHKLDINAPSCGANSFSAETMVATPSGEQAISTLTEGDVVLAYNEETGELDYYPVIDTISHEDPVVQYLTIDDETIITTPNHPFYTADGEWVPAGQLQVGDSIYRANGSYGIVQNREFVYQPQYMYNLSVADAHTYFVGDGQWLVHNITVTHPCIFLSKWISGKTRGVLEASDGLTPFVSGKDGGPATQMPPGTPGFDPEYFSNTDVESHAAAYMRQKGLMEATLYINKIPCGGNIGDIYGCQQLLPARLPLGAKLHIYVGHGSTFEFFDTFTGTPD